MTRTKKLLFLAGHLIVTVLAVAALLYFNYAQVKYWFSGDFNQNLTSIEISYVQMAKFWAEGGTGWQPQWYLGHPWHVFYTPLLPTLELVLGQALGWSFGHAYRVITGVGYTLVPVALFFFVWQLAKSKVGAAISALMYTTVPSIIAFLFSEVAADTVSGGLEPRRFAILVRWGEGPHTLALVFIPIFGLFFSRYLERGRLKDLLASSIFLGLAALTNAIAIWVALLLIGAFFLGEIIRGAEMLSTLKAILKTVLVTFGLVAFWFNLPFVTTFFREGGGAFSNWLVIFPWGLLALVAAGVGFFLIIKKLTAKFPSLAVGLFWFLALFAIVYVYYASGDNRLELVPQALRLNTEVDLALAALMGVLISNLYLYLLQTKGIAGYLWRLSFGLVWSVGIIALFFLGRDLASKLPEYTRSIAATRLERIENTAEFKIANQIKELVAGSDQRVFASGNYGFWLNFFVDTPQLRGGLFQSSTHFWPDHIYYQITNGGDSDISLAWLKIANIGKLVYTTAGSREPYHDFKVPQTKFDSLAAKLEEQGDIIFEVPLKNDSLAKIVNVGEILAIPRPVNAVDEKPIFDYVAAFERETERKVVTRRISDSQWRISGEIKEGEGVLFQSTYDSGWRIRRLDGSGVKGWKKARDNFDFMILVPKNPGKFEAELVYRKPWGVYLGYLLTAATLAWVGNRTYRTYLNSL